MEKAEEQSFEQQKNALQLFMFACNYDMDVMDKCIGYGCLPHLTQVCTCKSYSSLLSMVRQLAFEHSNQPSS
jgi:hypothetical protein